MRYLLFFLLLTTTAGAAEVRLAIDAVGRQAVLASPEITAARWRVEEARGRMNAAGRLNNPVFGFEFKNDTRLHQNAASVTLDQSFPVTRRLRREKHLSAGQFELARREVRAAACSLAAEVKSLALRFLMQKRRHTLLRQQAGVVAEISALAGKKTDDAGAAALLETTRARLEAQTLALAAEKLNNEVAVLADTLKDRLGVAETDSLVLTGNAPPLAMPPPAAWENNTALQRARTAEEVARRESILAESQEWDDISVGLILGGMHHDGHAGIPSDLSYFGVRMSVPLPLWKHNGGKVMEKNAAARRAGVEAKALAQSARREAAAVRTEMAAHLRRHTETQDTMLKPLQDLCERLEKEHAAGAAALSDVLQARRQRLQVEESLVDAELAFHLARVRHEALTAVRVPPKLNFPPLETEKPPVGETKQGG